MLWINTSNDIVKLSIDLGNGREFLTVLPSQTVELKHISAEVVDMLAPQLVPYNEFINKQNKPEENTILELVPVCPPIEKKRSGRPKRLTNV